VASGTRAALAHRDAHDRSSGSGSIG
jgi:hypothetical protein